MKLDPGMNIGMHLVFFGKAGVIEAVHVLYHVENSQMYTTSTLSSNRLVTLPPGLYKAR
jgi:hypothetical protein